MIRAERIKPRTKNVSGGQPPPLPDFRALFESVPDPCLVLDRNFQIVAVNDAYLSATMTNRDDIVGRPLFDVFPDNPDDDSATGASNVAASLRTVLERKVSDSMAVQRYDMRVPDPDGGFEERYWSASNTPVLGEDGEVVYIIHRVQDVTAFVRLKHEQSEQQKMTEELRQKTEAELFARSREVAETNRELKLTVAALHESQQLFTSFMDQLPAAAWIKSLDGNYVFANAAMERLFNVSSASILGKTGFEVFPEELASQFTGSDQQVLEEGVSKPFQVVRQAGEADRHLMVSKFAIPGEDGKPEYIAGLAFDVTETKQMEAELESLASYPLLNPSPVLELDSGGRTIFTNLAAEKLLETAGCPGRDCNPFIPPDLPTIVQQLKDGSITGHSREVQVDGRFFEELVTLVPQSDRIRCYTMDITKRKRAEAEREELLLKMEAVLESITEGVVISDLEGNVLTMNREALSLHGFEDADEARRHTAAFAERFELYDLSGTVIPLESWPLLRAVKGERFFDQQVRVTSKGSGKSWIGNYSGTPVVDREGKPILAVITIRDITGRIEMEKELAKLNVDLAARVADLESANQEMETFNRMVSHDLRQPLNTIGTSCQAVEMLCGDQLGADCKNYIHIAYDKVLSMNALIGALLSFSRSSHSVMKRESVNLSEIAGNVAGEIRLADPSRRVAFRIAEGVNGFGDANLLRSVLENLIGNAWKYTAKREEAQIEFGATSVEGENCFFVRDNGSGFEMSQAVEIFAPFKRLPGAEKSTGFGIGLATVDRIIRRHGGRVWAEGAPDKGATFYFTLGREEE